jgi:phosphoglycerate dehydrogenase-like enzyme
VRELMVEKPKVLVAVKIHEDGLRLLHSEGFRVVVNPRGRRVDEEWLCRELHDAWALMTTMRMRITEDILGCADRLRLIVTLTSGYDHIDLEACEKRGICVANTPEAISLAVAEHILGMTLALLRNVVRGDRYVRGGEWGTGPAPRELLSTMLRRKVVGVVGMGRIGAAASSLMRSVGAAEILYWSRRRKPEAEAATGAEFVDLDTLFRESDIVIITVALTPETRHLVDEGRLRLMKRSAVLVNTARGAVVDTEALVKALREGWIAGAALDVYEQEPLPPNHPLTQLKNTILTPHIAGYTRESIKETARLAALQVIEYYKRGRVRNPLTRTCSLQG